MQSVCEGSRIELPVVTHWCTATQAFEYLASDVPEIGGSATAPFTPGECYYEYNYDFLPDFNSYIADVYAQTEVTEQTARDFIAAACEDSGVRIDLLRPDAFTSKNDGLGRLVDRAGAVQILHAKVIDGSLATIILPPNWSSDAADNTYPIAVNGFYDINANLFTQEGPQWVRMIARSGTEGRSGAIGVLWNGGGATAGRTTNEAAYRQFNAVLDYVSHNFSSDKHRILMSGGSRGGLTAINMASNPYGYDYTVVFTAATATPTLLGEHASLTSTTYPPLLPSTAWSVGLADAWRTGWTYPACAGRPHLTGLSGPEAHLYILTGTSNLDEANTMHSPMSERFIQGLKDAGTRVFLTVTEKDNIVPYNTQVKYAQRLMKEGIPLQIEVLLRGGHTERFVDTVVGKAYVRIEKLLAHVLALVEDGSEPEFLNSLTYFAVNRATGDLDYLTPADGFVPFSVDGPYITAHGMRFPIVFVGHPETAYELKIETASGQLMGTFTGIIPADLTATHWFEVPADFPAGEYTYVLQIKKPGQNWSSILNTMTPSGDVATLTVEAEEPNIGPWQSWEWCTAPKLAVEEVPRANTNWGLTEY